MTPPPPGRPSPDPPARSHLVTERLASFDGWPLVVDQVGSRVGPPVVLLHGLRSSAYVNWHRPGTVDAIVAAGFRVFAPDARGHGRSGNLKRRPLRDEGAMAKDVIAIADHYGVDEMHLVGYSMGSMVAIGVTALDPRVRSLVLGGLGIEGLAGRIRLRRGPSAIVRGTHSGLGVDRGLGVSLLEQIRVPTLFVAGKDDWLIGSPDSLAAAVPGARAVTVPGRHLSAPRSEEFRRAIVAFLLEVTGGAAPPRPTGPGPGPGTAPHPG